MNSLSDRERIRQLVGHSAEFLALAEEGLERVRSMPDDLFAVLSNFLLVNSIRDWVKTERGLRSYWPEIPFSEAVREVANGTEHLELSPGSHPDPHDEGPSPWDDIDTIDWDEFGSPVPMIALCVRRSREEELRWRSALWVPEEALDGWRRELDLPPLNHAADH
jgi:hypothetical protein